MAEGGGVERAPRAAGPDNGQAKRFKLDLTNKGQHIDTSHVTNMKSDYKPAPRYLVLKHQDANKDLSKVSPFLINKMITYVAGGEVKNIKKLRNGTLIIETLTDKQTSNLMKLTHLSQDYPVEIKVHEKLNSSKGVIFCPDIMDFPVDEIKRELQDQHVIDVYRVTKFINGEKVDTPLHILTFDMPTLPYRIKAGFHVLDVKQYFNSPMRCRKCHLLGHTIKRCTAADNLCSFCATAGHLNGVCQKEPICINCKGSHPSNSNDCPKYIQEKEILIKVSNQKISYFAAKKQYEQEMKNKLQDKSYSQATKKSNSCSSCEELKQTVSALNEQIILLTNQLNAILQSSRSQMSVNLNYENQSKDHENIGNYEIKTPQVTNVTKVSAGTPEQMDCERGITNCDASQGAIKKFSTTKSQKQRTTRTASKGRVKK